MAGQAADVGLGRGGGVGRANRVRHERLCRQEGNIEDADFYARQLTTIELALEFGKQAAELVDIATQGRDPERPWTMSHPETLTRTPLTDLLARMREEGWRMARKGEPEHGVGAKLKRLTAEYEEGEG